MKTFKADHDDVHDGVREQELMSQSLSSKDESNPIIIEGLFVEDEMMMVGSRVGGRQFPRFIRRDTILRHGSSSSSSSTIASFRVWRSMVVCFLFTILFVLSLERQANVVVIATTTTTTSTASVATVTKNMNDEEITGSTVIPSWSSTNTNKNKIRLNSSTKMMSSLFDWHNTTTTIDPRPRDHDHDDDDDDDDNYDSSNEEKQHQSHAGRGHHHVDQHQHDDQQQKEQEQEPIIRTFSDSRRRRHRHHPNRRPAMPNLSVLMDPLNHIHPNVPLHYGDGNKQHPYHQHQIRHDDDDEHNDHEHDHDHHDRDLGGDWYSMKKKTTKDNKSNSNSNEQYQPLRIHFDTRYLEAQRGISTSIDAEINDIITNVLPKAAQQWSKHLSVIPVQGTISTTSKSCHSIFGYNFQSSLLNSQSSYVVNNADLVVMVGGNKTLYDNDETISVCHGDSIAVSSPCTLDQYDRPIVGFLNYCLDKSNGSSNSNGGTATSSTSSGTTITSFEEAGSAGNGEEEDQTFEDMIQDIYSTWANVELRDVHVETNRVEITIHEMAHILGHSATLYRYYRDPERNGEPRTSRPFQQSTQYCPSTNTEQIGYFPDINTIQLASTRSNGRKESFVVLTPRVQQVVRNHFNCQSMVGARLEDPQEGSSSNTCIGSHWHEREHYGELMGPYYTKSSDNMLSPLTLALMEDSGWYRVNYQDSTIPSFGLGMGCNFIDEDCIINDMVPPWGKDSFCSNPFRFDTSSSSKGIEGVSKSSLDSIVCDPGHRQWVICDLIDESTIKGTRSDSDTIRYFSNPNLISLFDHADYCPIPDTSLGLDCTINDEYNIYYAGESVGINSRCYNTHYTQNHNDGGDVIRRPACMNTICDTTNNVVRIGDTSNGIEYICEYDGQLIPIPMNNNNGNHDDDTATAYLECPALMSICPQLFACPSSCSGKGICNYTYRTTAGSSGDDGGGGPVPYSIQKAQCDCYDENVINDGCYEPINVGSPTPPPTPSPAQLVLFPNYVPTTTTSGNDWDSSISITTTVSPAWSPYYGDDDDWRDNISSSSSSSSSGGNYKLFLSSVSSMIIGLFIAFNK